MDLCAALERAVRYKAFSYKAIERILSVQARPHTVMESLADDGNDQLRKLVDDDGPVQPRDPAEYQGLIDGQDGSDDESDQ